MQTAAGPGVVEAKPLVDDQGPAEILGADEMALELPRTTPELIEFLKATVDSGLGQPISRTTDRFEIAGSTRDGVARILENFPFANGYTDFDRDVDRVVGVLDQ